MKTIIAKPLTRANFKSYGEVIEMEGARHYPINGGKAERFHDLATVEAVKNVSAVTEKCSASKVHSAICRETASTGQKWNSCKTKDNRTEFRHVHSSNNG